MGDVEAGFAKLQGEDFEYYMQTYSIVLGRNSKKSSVDIDLSYLGGGMNISRQHARIYYDFDRKRFALEVIGKNGCLVEGVLYLPGNPPIKLDSQDLLQIGDKKFYFLLPVRKIVKPQHQHLNLNANANNAPLALPTSAVAVPGGASGTLKKRGGRKEDDHYQQQEPQHPPTKKWRSQGKQDGGLDNPSRGLSSNHHQKVINQHQLSNQQQLMNQLQLHYDDQQKQYHLVQSNQLSQQQQHSILGSLQEQLVLQLHHHQQNLQSEKQQQPIWTNLPVHLLDNSGVSHHQQVQNPDILSEKEKMQRQELYNCQSVSLHKGASQVLSKDASNLPDPIEPKNIPKSQQHDSGHLQESQVDMQVLAHTQSKPVAFAESHPTRAGDVKLFGQVLVSQPTSCMNITPSPSENAFSQPAFSLVSVPASTVVVSVSEGLPDTYPDGTPCVPSGLGRIGPSFTQGHGFNLPWQSTSAGGFGGRNNLLDGRQLACFVKRSDSENDMQNSQVALSRMAQRLIRDTKECDNNCPEGASPSQKFEGCEQLKRMQDDQNAVTGLGIKRSIDQGNVLILNGDLSASNSDLKSDMPRVPGIADLSSMLSRNKDLDMSSTVGAMLGVPVSSTQALPGTVVDAHLAIADWHNSRELRFVGSHSSKELHQSQDFPGNKVCHANDAGKLVITNNQPLPLAHSFAVGVENSQFTRENSFFGQQAILPGSGNVGLNMSMWNSGTVVGSGNDLLRVNMPTVSSVWAHHSMTVESRPRTADSRDAEDNKRNT